VVRELSYRLTNPGYTIYHRAALGGLASTLKVLERRERAPEGLSWEVQPEHVRLWWRDELRDADVLRSLLAESFRLTDDLIDLPGQDMGEENSGLRVAVHNGLCATFLQHRTTRASKGSRTISVPGAEEDEPVQVFSYLALQSYMHQEAQGLGLLDSNDGALPEVATIPQSLVPGAVTGARALDGNAEEVFLLLYLMVGAAVFQLRPRGKEPRFQTCIVVPDVADLVAYAESIRQITATGREHLRSLRGAYAARVAGSAEEAALRWAIDLTTQEIAEHTSIRSIHGCVALTMGKVAWDRKQANRSGTVRVQPPRHYAELGVFLSAHGHLGGTRTIRKAKGESSVEPDNPVPSLVATNLAREHHWARGFAALSAEQRQFRHLSSRQRGLSKMKEAIRDEDDRVVVEVFYEAWRKRRGQLRDRAKREAANAEHMIDSERERVRNAILRARTADSLVNWFLRFCTEAARERPMPTFQRESERLRRFLFDQHNAERLQNLFLFALLSYVPSAADPQGESNVTPLPVRNDSDR
jgi:CRISPR-associated protein Cas8a1/Csx13